MRVSVYQVRNQREALKALADLARKSSVHPSIRRAALAITNDCPSRDDACELQAIFNAVKSGDSRIAGLGKGLRYVSDPRYADFFTAPHRVLDMCKRYDACGGDCDDHAALVCALGSAIGFRMGFRAYGQEPRVFTHVYAIAGFPKRGPKDAVGMDTTVPYSNVGWQPPRGYVMDEWL